jgi:hypothetical protein
MEMCSNGHDEIVIEGFCPACELLAQQKRCPVCSKGVPSDEDVDKENERLNLIIFDLETKLQREKDKNLITA